MSPTPKPTAPDRRDDPVFLHGRREAIIILIVWAMCLMWTVGYGYTMGFEIPEGPIATVMGIPRWVFWGVAAPWAMATVFSILFGVFYMADDDLGENQPQAPGSDDA